MKNENKEIFIPGPSGRIQAKYYKSKQQGAPVALVLQPHPQYGGTMNNRIIYETYNSFYKNGFSVIRINFRGVEKSEGVFDNGLGELSDAAAALDWIEKENPGFSQCWVSGFSFGSLICMQLIMRRPEVNKFIAISPQPNIYDFAFLAPCPISGLVIYGKNDELVTEDSILNLKKRLSLHNTGKGAKFTRGRRWKIIYTEKYATKREAISREYYIKKNRKFRNLVKTLFG